ncbi:hypothetical protein ES288_A13G155800v1 [Gossypium darwinii]|uniref:Uncharacterized protein n=1 Tax=Gossypium darwinii TaxID=34276 RepID=A0A5D2E0L8_GOSDA|nr:hypothetical protein ES288_A13G155800v1 [Gossypium darwinii]
MFLWKNFQFNGIIFETNLNMARGRTHKASWKKENCFGVIGLVSTYAI